MRIVNMKQGDGWAELTVESLSWVDARATYTHRIERTPEPRSVNGWPVSAWRIMTRRHSDRWGSEHTYARSYWASREEAAMVLLSGLGFTVEV